MTKQQQVIKVINEGLKNVRFLRKEDNVSKVVKFHVNSCVKMMINLLKQAKVFKNEAVSAELTSFKHSSIVISQIQWVGMELSSILNSPSGDNLPYFFGMLVNELIRTAKNLETEEKEVL